MMGFISFVYLAGIFLISVWCAIKIAKSIFEADDADKTCYPYVAVAAGLAVGIFKLLHYVGCHMDLDLLFCSAK